LPSGASGRGQEPIALLIERHGIHPAERLVVEVGEAGIDLQVFEQRQNLDRCLRPDRELNVGVSRAQRRGEGGNHRERGRNGGDAQPAVEAVLEDLYLLPHGTGVADDSPRPAEHPLAFGREALKTRGAVDQRHAHHLFELLDARRQGRLRHPAGLGGPPKMPLAGEG
jgi:hypothetical protein